MRTNGAERFYEKSGYRRISLDHISILNSYVKDLREAGARGFAQPT